MNCDEARAAFTDLHDGALAGELLEGTTRHLEGCPACRHEYAVFRRTVQSLTDLGAEDPSPGFAARVTKRIQAPRWWHKAARALVYPLPVKLPLHAAALVVLGMAGIWVSQRSPELQRAVDMSVSAPVPAERAIEAPSVPSASPPAAARPRDAAPPAPVTAEVAREKLGPGDTSEHSTRERPSRDEPVPPTASGAARDAESENAALGLSRSMPAPAETPDRTGPGLRTDARRPGGERALLAPAVASADETFSAAAAEFAAQRYDRAIERFGVFLAQHPADARAPDAQFFAAEAYRALGRHAEASAGFAAFLRRHPAHPLAPSALYRQAESRLASADPAGCAVLRDALARYPDAPEAPRAREALASRCP